MDSRDKHIPAPSCWQTCPWTPGTFLSPCLPSLTVTCLALPQLGPEMTGGGLDSLPAFPAQDGLSPARSCVSLWQKPSLYLPALPSPCLPQGARTRTWAHPDAAAMEECKVLYETFPGGSLTSSGQVLA